MIQLLDFPAITTEYRDAIRGVRDSLIGVRRDAVAAVEEALSSKTIDSVTRKLQERLKATGKKATTEVEREVQREAALLRAYPLLYGGADLEREVAQIAQQANIPRLRRWHDAASRTLEDALISYMLNFAIPEWTGEQDPRLRYDLRVEGICEGCWQKGREGSGLTKGEFKIQRDISLSELAANPREILITDYALNHGSAARDLYSPICKSGKRTEKAIPLVTVHKLQLLGPTGEVARYAEAQFRMKSGKSFVDKATEYITGSRKPTGLPQLVQDFMAATLMSRMDQLPRKYVRWNEAFSQQFMRGTAWWEGNILAQRCDQWLDEFPKALEAHPEEWQLYMAKYFPRIDASSRNRHAKEGNGNARFIEVTHGIMPIGAYNRIEIHVRDKASATKESGTIQIEGGERSDIEHLGYKMAKERKRLENWSLLEALCLTKIAYPLFGHNPIRTLVQGFAQKVVERAYRLS
ncbi:hypothetical protein HYY74_02475 [Candidatus Woesearchaeota archaeon]|nr:hypothetical protein [Candidatus Woesearchaeota archaeon]